MNPDNPSGNYIKKADVLRICAWAKDKQIRLIMDESFVDFVDAEEDKSLLEQKLSEVSFLRVIPSQANYVLCEVLAPMTSKTLTVQLLEKNILIKDLAEKNGFAGKQYVRIAVRDDKDNQALVDALKELQ